MAFKIILPKLTYEMQTGRILEWLCTEGQTVSAGQPLFVVETDKATTEVPADETGVLLKIVVRAEVEIPVGTTVAWIGLANENVPDGDLVSTDSVGVAPVEAVPVLTEPTGSETLPAEPIPADEIMATPVAKRMARELGVDLKAVAGHAGKQRVREADVQAYIEARAQLREASHPSPTVPQETAPAATAAITGPLPSVGMGEYQIIQPTPLQRAMAARMTQAALVPQSAAGCEVNLSALDAFRDSLQAGWEKEFDFRLSYTHLIAALMARAVKTCPLLNASWTEEGSRLYASVNLGVAMATARGLVVPVVQRAHERSLGDVAQEIVRLRHAAQTNRLGPQDLQGGTVTLTNAGTLGIEFPVPVLNPPQSAIVAIGARRTKLILDDGQVRPVAVMSITLVSDHRLVDGAVQGAFLQTFQGYLENPAQVLTV